MKNLLMSYTIMLFVLGCSGAGCLENITKPKESTKEDPSKVDKKQVEVKQILPKDFLLPCGLKIHATVDYTVEFDKDPQTNIFLYTWLRGDTTVFNINMSDAKLYGYNTIQCYNAMYKQYKMKKTTICIAGDMVEGGECESLSTNEEGNTVLAKIYTVILGKFVTFFVIPPSDTNYEVILKEWLRNATWVK